MNDNHNKVNIDYVLIVMECDGHLEIRSIPTKVPHDSIDRLSEMLKDDRCSLILMQNEVTAVLPEKVPCFIDYLAPRACSEAYVRAAQYPKMLSSSEYEQAQIDAEEIAEKRLKERLLSEYPNVVDAEKREKLFARQVVEERNKARKDKVNELKTSFFYSARQYLYAWYYRNTIDANRIKDRLKENVKMYSTDTIGFTHFKYPISNDVEIKLHTNFGYGVASYFRLELTYKGIPILPYSFYVNYFYANSRDIARYTRLYQPEREKWCDAFKFVVETTNLAAKDPNRFVREWVMSEVTTMVNKLNDIMNEPMVYMGKWLDKMNIANGESPYLHVRHMDPAAAYEYKCYPHEMIIDFKSKKISGALDFLDSLKALKPIYDNVDKAIETIKDLGRAVVPEIKSALSKINTDIDGLKAFLKVWQDRCKKLEVRIRVFELECKKLVASRLAKIDHSKWGQYSLVKFEVEVQAEYERQHPNFTDHKRAYDWCAREKLRLEVDIQHRTRFKMSLEAYESKINRAKL